MTLPRERYYAVINAGEFLRSLLDPKKTPRVPSEIRRQAYQRLKHYPHAMDMERVAEVLPELFGDK